jgi:hypothetical protein
VDFKPTGLDIIETLAHGPRLFIAGPSQFKVVDLLGSLHEDVEIEDFSAEKYGAPVRAVPFSKSYILSYQCRFLTWKDFSSY